MGLFSFLKRSSWENPNFTLSQKASWDWFGLGRRSVSGEVVTRQTSLAVPAIWACWRVLSETVASLQWDVYQEDGDKISKDTQHPYSALLKRSPNPFHTSFTFREILMLNALSGGVMYAYIVRDGNGVATEIYPLDSETVSPIPPKTMGGQLYYRVSNMDAPIPAINMICVPAMSFDGIDPNSPIVSAREIVGESLAAQRLSNDYYGNGAMLTGVLQTDMEIPVVEKKKMKESWNNEHGRGKRGGTAILSHGLKYTPISNSLEEAQMKEMREFMVTEVCRIYNVPPHMVFELTKSSFNNIAQMSLDFAKYTIRPWIKRIEEEFNRKLFSVDTTRFVKFNMDSILRADIETRMNAYQIARMIGLNSINELRQMEGRNPIEGGDDHTPLMLAQVNPDGEEEADSE